MKIFILVNPGMEEVAQQEVKELANVSAKVYDSVLEVEVDDYSKLKKLQS